MSLTDLLTTDWVFLALFAFAVLDGFFPPIPSETAVIALASTWASEGSPDLVLVIGVAAFGAFGGDQLAYQVGRWLFRTRDGRVRRGRRAVERAATMLTRRGGPLLLAARFVPGGRAAVTAAAGAVGFPRRRFIGWTAGGAVLWAGYYAAIGTIAGAWLRGNTVVAVLVGVAGGIALGLVVDRLVQTWSRRRRRAVLADETLDEALPTAP